jgi:NarL family two-component system response regulator LiaR
LKSDTRPIRIILVDDHAVLRSGLKYITEIIDTIEVVGEASNGVEAIHLYHELKPDVVLMDLMMPEMDGIEATRRITRESPDARVIVLSSSKEEDMVQEALGAGAVSYLTKNISSAELTHAIEKAFTGVPTLSPEITEALILSKTRPTKPSFDLTTRELEVLEKLIIGQTNPQIAEALHISRATVKRHLSNVYSKLQVTSRTEAVAVAIKHNIVKST